MNHSIKKFDEGAWRTRTVFIGGIAGVIIGLVSAYLYMRAAEDHIRKHGEPPRAQNGELLGLALAALAVVRQISELGRPEGKKR